jgi:hypothetical protein
MQYGSMYVQYTYERNLYEVQAHFYLWSTLKDRNKATKTLRAIQESETGEVGRKEERQKGEGR